MRSNKCEEVKSANTISYYLYYKYKFKNKDASEKRLIITPPSGRVLASQPLSHQSSKTTSQLIAVILRLIITERHVQLRILRKTLLYFYLQVFYEAAIKFFLEVLKNSLTSH